MSYCVNCGVELDSALKKCPLCGVRVINPKKKDACEAESPFPETRDELKKADRVFWINFISILCAAPAVTCLLCNFVYNNTIDWSLYVIAGIVMLWSVCTSPFLFKKLNYVKMVTTDMIGILGGLLIIALVSSGSGWFLLIALPVLVFCYLSWLLVLWLTKKKTLKGLKISAAYIVAVTVVMLLLETLISLYSYGAVKILWSWLIIAPFLSIAALLILLDRSPRVKQELSRRLHI